MPVKRIHHVGAYALDGFNIFYRGAVPTPWEGMDAEIRRYLDAMKHSHS